MREVIIIAAHNNNKVIGRNGDIPWHISSDLKRFKRLTQNHLVLMGRKTFDSLNMSSGLPNRINIVLSSSLPDNHFDDENNCYISRSVMGTKNLINNYLSKEHEIFDKKLFIIGGESIYESFLPLSDYLYLSKVDNDEMGDAYFPDIPNDLNFDCVYREPFDEYDFEVHKRIRESRDLLHI